VESVWINGHYHQLGDYLKDPCIIDSLPVFEKEIISFIIDWKAGRDRFLFNSSGSTGTPKKIALHRDRMIISAESTMDFLEIPAGGKALLCLDPRYIAGKMVILRSLIGHLDLYAIDPKSNPLKEFEPEYTIDLASFVPYQIAEIFEDSDSLKKFRNIKNVLIGGAGISPRLERKLGTLKNDIYHTFGMTETVSHIALRPLSGIRKSQYFKLFPGTTIGKDERGCLTVEGRITGDERHITNDLVEIVNEKEFEWKGRIDDIINTGGIKVNISLLEIRIREILESIKIYNNFFIDHISDEKLGEKIVLILESRSVDIDSGIIKATLKKHLDRFEIPRQIQVIKEFALTDTGKINRKLIMRQIRGL
jgi:O-succinylbenzoic acid--CoA ligase